VWLWWALVERNCKILICNCIPWWRPHRYWDWILAHIPLQSRILRGRSRISLHCRFRPCGDRSPCMSGLRNSLKIFVFAFCFIQAGWAICYLVKLDHTWGAFDRIISEAMALIYIWLHYFCSTVPVSPNVAFYCEQQTYTLQIHCSKSLTLWKFLTCFRF